MNRQTIWWLLLVSVLCTLAVSACQLPLIQSPIPTPTAEQTVALPFETIELREPSKPDYWVDAKPGLLVITATQGIAPVSQYISDDAIATLQHMDFSQYFALVAFDGLKPTVHYDFEIQKVIRNDAHIYVFARSSRTVGQEATSSLYHLVKIKKSGEWGQTFTFHLYVGNKASNATLVASYIP